MAHRIFTWDRSVQIEGDVAEGVAELKRGDGPELQVHGSGNLIQTLMAHDLIDEYRLWVFPLVIGSGKRLFADGTIPAALRLVDSKVSTTGVIDRHVRARGKDRDRVVRGGLMSDVITPRVFHDAEGVEDWRALMTTAQARFRTRSFAKGVALVDEIGRLADAANHHPDVHLRYATVTVRLTSHDVQGLSERDVALARQISAAARSIEVVADPASVQDVQFTIDALVAADVMPFWQAVLGYKQVGDEDLLDPRDEGPPIWFQEMEAERPQRNRIHVDVFVPHDQAEERVAAALAAGGRLVSDEHAPAVVDPGRRRGQRGRRRDVARPLLIELTAPASPARPR